MHTQPRSHEESLGRRTESLARVRRPAARVADLQAYARRAELEAYGRRTAAANGFGDAGLDLRPSVIDLYDTARRDRAAEWSRIASAASRSIGALARRLLAAWRRSREESATRLALRELDRRTLHDLGLDRSEIESVAAGIAGDPDMSRARSLRSLRALL